MVVARSLSTFSISFSLSSCLANLYSSQPRSQSSISTSLFQNACATVFLWISDLLEHSESVSCSVLSSSSGAVIFQDNVKANHLICLEPYSHTLSDSQLCFTKKLVKWPSVSTACISLQFVLYFCRCLETCPSMVAVGRRLYNKFHIILIVFFNTYPAAAQSSQHALEA